MAQLPVHRQSTDEPAILSDPLGDFQRLCKELTRLVDSWPAFTTFLGDAFTPFADVEELGDAYVVALETPGIKKGDIEISVADRRLTVCGERREHEILRHRPRSVGRFQYEVVLPSAANENEVSANLDRGVLTIRVSKAAKRPRHIEIN